MTSCRFAATEPNGSKKSASLSHPPCHTAKVLFGNCHHSFEDRIYSKFPVLSQHRLYRDFPEPGDVAYFSAEDVLIMRHMPDSSHCRYRSVLVFGTPEDKWATWASPQYPAFTHIFHSTVERVLNGPNIRDMRDIDANMYLVLNLHSFNHGHPMVPQSNPRQDSVTVAAGKHLGLMSGPVSNLMRSST